jgi:hypothetical protein
METVCSYCGLVFQVSRDRCPHCARPSLFPNVVEAMRSEEKVALEERYRSAMADADARGCRNAVEAFEESVGQARVVINRSILETLRIAASDREVYGTYYQVIAAGIRLPSGDRWDTLRPLVDSALFPDYKDEIRFGSLSLDGVGVSQFGPCSLTLRVDLVEYRVSLFEKNSILFMERAGITIGGSTALPRGYRSVWIDRGRHAVAKLAHRVSSSTALSDHTQLLLTNAMSPEGDDFIEAHVYGPMTIRTMEKVSISGKLTRSERAMIGGLREMLDAASVTMELHR